MDIFIESFLEQLIVFLRTYETILSFLAIIPLAYIILFIPVQISRFLKFRRRHKEFESFEIKVKESFQQHYEILEQLENFLKQRISLNISFTQGKIPLFQEISPAHWQLYESDFTKAAKATSTAINKYSSLRTYPQFISLLKRVNEQRIYLMATEKAYNLTVYNYNTARRAGILTFLFALSTGKKSKKSISLTEIAPDKLLEEKSEHKNQPEFPPLKTNAEFKQFYDETLIHKIQLLEELRQEYARQIRKILFIATPIIIVFAVLMIIFNQEANEHPLGVLFALLPLSIIITVMITRQKIKAIKNKRASRDNEEREERIQRIIRRLNSSSEEEFSDYETAFHNQIISPIVTFVSDKLDYNQQVMSINIFVASGLFQKPDKYSSFITLRGLIDKSRFILSEVKTAIITPNEHPNPRNRPIPHTLFNGLFYKINFSKILKGNIYLLPSSIIRELKKQRAGRSRSHHYHIYKNNIEIHFMDDSDFTKNFSVFAEDSATAYHLLAPSLRCFFVEIQQRFKGKKIYASCIQGTFYLAIQNENLGFKPSLMKTLLNYEKFEQYFEHIRYVLEISQKFVKSTQ